MGCTVTPTKAPQSQIETLSLYIQGLDRSVPYKANMEVSLDIFQKVRNLTKEFALTSPPLWHNFLVNVGLRNKGLCFHWSDALYLYLKKRHGKYFEFHLVGANIGEYFLEHNALVIVAKGAKVKEGLIIDPWRNSGKLYFSLMKDDSKYRWTHRRDRGCE